MKEELDEAKREAQADVDGPERPTWGLPLRLPDSRRNESKSDPDPHEGQAHGEDKERKRKVLVLVPVLVDGRHRSSCGVTPHGFSSTFHTPGPGYAHPGTGEIMANATATPGIPPSVYISANSD